MVPEKILYTDEHDVTVTDSSLKVKKEHYRLNGIVNHWLNTLRPHRAPWIAICALGVIILIAGILNIFPESWNIDLDTSYLLINPCMFWLGIFMVVLSAVILVVQRDRYAVRISVAQGEKDVIVSRNKAYIMQIVAAMNQAFNIYWAGRQREPAYAHIADNQHYQVEMVSEKESS